MTTTSPKGMAAMGQVKTTKDVYEVFGAALASVVAAPSASASVGELDQTIQFVISEPDAVVTAKLHRETSRVDLGPTNLAADVTLRMSGTTAEQFFMGDLNPFLAADQGALVIEGDAAKLALAWPLLRFLVSIAARQNLDGPTPNGWPAGSHDLIQEFMGHPGTAVPTG